MRKIAKPSSVIGRPSANHEPTPAVPWVPSA